MGKVSKSDGLTSESEIADVVLNANEDGAIEGDGEEDENFEGFDEDEVGDDEEDDISMNSSDEAWGDEGNPLIHKGGISLESSV